MSSPLPCDVHVSKPIGADDEKKRRGDIAKRGRAGLYVYRNIVNGAEIAAWCRANGFPTVRDPETMHVTITYSKDPVDWLAMGEPDSWPNPDADGNIKLPAGGPRVLESFGGQNGNPKVIVLAFASNSLSWRHRAMRDKGASWKWPDYTPHITLCADAGDFDFEALKPYAGEIVLGPEIFEPIDEKWTESVVEKHAPAMGESRETEDGGFGTFYKVAGVDEGLGLVFGWAIVCKVNGEDYYDLNIDHDGKRVPEHITEPAMMKGAFNFMKSDRVGNDMHAGPDSGTYVFAFPLTTEIAKAMKIDCPTTGLMVAYAPEPHVLSKFKSGEYTGFSIEGSRVRAEEVSG